MKAVVDGGGAPSTSAYPHPGSAARAQVKPPKIISAARKRAPDFPTRLMSQTLGNMRQPCAGIGYKPISATLEGEGGTGNHSPRRQGNTPWEIRRRHGTETGMNVLLNRIAIDPEICGGKPRIRGTRIWVALILDLLAQGLAENELLDEYPGLVHEDVLAAIAYGAEMSRVT
jgi:uncharacterized protein (DUF433 family)